MEEKRKHKRAPFNSKISIESFFKSGERETLKANADIIIENISKDGIGFITDMDLPLNHFFNCKIQIDEEKTIFCVLKIVRTNKTDDGYDVGAQFVGLADLLGDYINEYVEFKDK